MIKFVIALLATSIAVATVSTAAQAAPLARVGVGQVYANVTDCAANSGTYTPSEAAMAYARVHPSKGTPVYGANATGTVCVLMHTSVPGKAEDGQRQGDHWVRVPKKYVYQEASGGMIYYTLCNNPISQVEEQFAVQVSEAPCTDCAEAPKVPAAQASVTYTDENSVTYEEAPRRVAYQGSSVQFNLPGQSIGQGLFPQAVSGSVLNQTSNTNYFTLPTVPTTPTQPTPPFGGVTQPPAGNGFGGVTQPPSGNGFDGVTQPPAPVPGPQPVGTPSFGGGTASPVPGPVSNIGFGGGFSSGNNGGFTNLPAPVFGGNTNIASGNLFDFGGNTSSSNNFSGGNTFTGSTGIIQGPISNGVVTSTTTVVNGVQGPVQGPVSNLNTGNVNPGFGGFTAPNN